MASDAGMAEAAVATALSLEAIFEQLRSGKFALQVDETGRLVYVGPRRALDASLRAGLMLHYWALVDLFRPPASHDPTRQLPPRPWRCIVAGCTELILDDEKWYCSEHRAQANASLSETADAPGTAPADETPEPPAATEED